MGVLGDNEDQAKAAARRVADQATTLGHFLAVALAASTAATPTLVPGLATSVALCHLWAWVQGQVANDPPRDDTWDFPPPPPVGTRRYLDSLGGPARYGTGDPSIDLNAPLLAHCYAAASALRCSERAAGAVDRLSPALGATPGPTVVWSAQAALRQFYLELALRSGREVSFYFLERVLSQVSTSRDEEEAAALIDSFDHVAAVTQAVGRLGIEQRHMRLFGLSIERWSLLPFETDPTGTFYDSFGSAAERDIDLSLRWGQLVPPR